MKTLRLLSLLVPLYILGGHPASSAEQEKHPTVIDWTKGAPVETVFSTYRRLTGKDLFIDSQAYLVKTPIKLKTDFPVPRDQAVKLLEKALLQQAGIVVTPLVDGKISITYNDKLPIGSDGKTENR